MRGTCGIIGVIYYVIFFTEFPGVVELCHNDSSECVACDVPSQWSSWSNWSSCSSKCNFGTRSRRRQFENILACCHCYEENGTESCGATNNGCEQECNEENGSCGCRTGYVLNHEPASSDNTSSPECCDSDGKQCKDVDECKNPDICQHDCQNNVGGYECNCFDGFYKGADPSTCIPRPCTELRLPTCQKMDDQKCQNITVYCTNNFLFNSTCSLRCPEHYKLAKIGSDFSFKPSLLDADFQSVSSNIKCIYHERNVQWDLSHLEYQNYYCRRKNDAPSEFKLSNNNILEHKPKDTPIGNFTVKDENISNIDYIIRKSEGYHGFYIKSNTLYNSKPFKLLNLQNTSIDILVEASDKGIPPFIVDGLFTINIINVNDPPMKLQLSNETVTNTDPVGKIIGRFSAIDYDEINPERSSDNFNWNLVNNSEGYFRLNGSYLVLAKSLGDLTDASLNIDVRCSDKDPENPQSVITLFNLSLVKYEYKPRNVSLTFSSLKEDSSVNITVGSLKFVQSTRFNLTFNLTGGKDYFHLKATTCNVSNDTKLCKADLVLTKALNFEELSVIKLRVQFNDSWGVPVELKELDINVVDVNESPTDMHVTFYEIHKKSLIGDRVGDITVIDQDRETQYRCYVGENVFEIEKNHIIILKQALSFTKSFFNITINCSDGEYGIKRNFRINVSDTCSIPGCDRNEDLCKDRSCQAGQICSTFKHSTNRCVPVDNQMKILLKMPPAKRSKAFLYDFEGYMEAILEGRRGERTLNDMKGNDVCQQPKDSGTCKAYIEKWYFNAEKGKCEIFIYGGCEGNGNNFFTLDDCNQKCGDCPDVCPAIYDPVCGSDDISYPNGCELRKAACKNDIKITELSKGTCRKSRRRRSTPAINIHIEAISIRLLGEEYLYLSAIPRDIHSNFEFLLASSYCPLLNGTDIRCINAEDCRILKRYGIECSISSTPGGRISVTDENKKDDEKMFLAWLIPVIILIAVLLVIASICIAKRRYQYQKKNEPVIFNNQTNDVSYDLLQRNSSVANVANVEHRNDIMVMDNEIFRPRQAEQQAEYPNPSYGLALNNLAYETDGKPKNIPVNPPIYATIEKDNYENSADVIDDLPPPYEKLDSDKAKALESDSLVDGYDHIVRRGPSLNQYNPELDDKDKLAPKYKINDLSNDKSNC